MRGPAGRVTVGRPRAVDGAHDQRFAAAILKKLFDRVGQRGRLPQAAEDLLVAGEAADAHRPRDRAAQGATNESGNASGRALNSTPGPGRILESASETPRTAHPQ